MKILELPPVLVNTFKKKGIEGKDRGEVRNRGLITIGTDVWGGKEDKSRKFTWDVKGSQGRKKRGISFPRDGGGGKRGKRA